VDRIEKDRDEAGDWAVALFRRSVLKQAKWNAIRKETGDTAGKRCLDLGSDNGVISLLLREEGGTWRSADLDPAAVASIRSLIGDPVEQLTGPSLPYDDGAFDLVVVVDLMEHLEDDTTFVGELARVLSPHGRLVVNVPHLTPRSPLRRLRYLVGLTDEKHGHVRPGYDRDSLGRLLDLHFENIRFQTYVGPFSELVDILLSWALGRKKGAHASSKGAVLTRDESTNLGAIQTLYSLVYPFLKVFSLLDHVAPFLSRFMLISTASRKKGDS
jgi:SAM-dependent methyltransferase